MVSKKLQKEPFRRSYRHPGNRRAFTLIEVLVVVAIIALLAAVLLPSLQNARIQTRIASCKANCKQIGTLIAMYRSEYNDFVPIMFNYYAGGDPEHSVNPTGHNAPAKGCWMSVALRKYDQATVHLNNIASKSVPGKFFNPDVKWDGNQTGGVCKLRDEFEDRIMPDFYACPFEREGGDGRDLIAVRNGIEFHEWRGRFDSYHTWLWDDLVRRGVKMQPVPGGDSYLDGIVQYSVLIWNKVKKITPPSGQRWDTMSPPNPYFHKYHRQWKASDARELGAGSLAEVTISFCAQGEHLALGNLRYNVGNHRTARGGGTNAIFGDTHVEWIKGTRIGWR